MRLPSLLEAYCAAHGLDVEAEKRGIEQRVRSERMPYLVRTEGSGEKDGVMEAVRELARKVIGAELPEAVKMLVDLRLEERKVVCRA